jgi:hypothetical protein
MEPKTVEMRLEGVGVSLGVALFTLVSSFGLVYTHFPPQEKSSTENAKLALRSRFPSFTQ